MEEGQMQVNWHSNRLISNQFDCKSTSLTGIHKQHEKLLHGIKI